MTSSITDLDIINFPFLDGDIPTSYGVYQSQLIRIADVNNRNKVLTAKLRKQGYRYHKLRKVFYKFYRRPYDHVSKLNVGLKWWFIIRALHVLKSSHALCPRVSSFFLTL